jgi:uncharacterized membrane-anchored protein YitT (DUF2179 family)
LKVDGTTNKEKKIFADFGWYFFCVFVKISKKLRVMQKPAAHRKNNITVLSIFYGILNAFFYGVRNLQV